jgi:hypothetical protein
MAGQPVVYPVLTRLSHKGQTLMRQPPKSAISSTNLNGDRDPIDEVSLYVRETPVNFSPYCLIISPIVH